MFTATNDAFSREGLAGDKESRFFRSIKAHRPITLKEHTVQFNIARKKHPNKRSQKNLDGHYEVLAPSSVVQKTDQFTSVIREPGKLEVTVRNSDNAKFGTRDERKTNSSEWINRIGPKVYEKSTEAKMLSHTKEFTRIQKGDGKMKHRKRDTAGCVSSNRSNIARAMRVRMPKVPPNLVPPETSIQPETNHRLRIIAPPPTNQLTELMLPSTSAPLENIAPSSSKINFFVLSSSKITLKSPKSYGFGNDNSSGESINSCLPDFAPPRRKRHTGDVESVQPSDIQTIVDTAAQVELTPNAIPSPVIDEVSPTDPRIRPASQSPPENLIIDEQNM